MLWFRSFQRIKGFWHPMPAATSFVIVEGKRDVACLGAFLPGFVLAAIVLSYHGDAVFHRANQRAKVTTNAVFFNDVRLAVAGIST